MGVCEIKSLEGAEITRLERVPGMMIIIGALSTGRDEGGKYYDEEFISDGVYYSFAKLASSYKSVFRMFGFKKFREDMYHSKMLEEIMFQCYFWKYVAAGNEDHYPKYKLTAEIKESNIKNLKTLGCSDEEIKDLEKLGHIYRAYYHEFQSTFRKIH
jgi:hypothetical protein